LQLVSDPERPSLEVDVLPPEAEHLAAAQAESDQQDERRVQRAGLAVARNRSVSLIVHGTKFRRAGVGTRTSRAMLRRTRSSRMVCSIAGFAGADRGGLQLGVRREARLDPDAEIRELLDHIDDAEDADVLVVKDWHYAGRGYLDLSTAAAAVTSAVLARARRRPGGLLDRRPGGRF
jgi:hypothetical protein